MNVTELTAKSCAKVLANVQPVKGDVGAALDMTEVVVVCLDEEFPIDCVQWINGKVVIRIEPEDMR